MLERNRRKILCHPQKLSSLQPVAILLLLTALAIAIVDALLAVVPVVHAHLAVPHVVKLFH